ncbi:MAG: hypothetical protein HY831_04135 [Candidatus Aenigmarchaeota archaeon]|nr:hypothetical protein [Candidatus Aenigmarchaeota archaeon]
MVKRKIKVKKVKHVKHNKVKKKEQKEEDKYFISYVPEVKLLEKGHVPTETKMGTEFKGKNKIWVSK